MITKKVVAMLLNINLLMFEIKNFHNFLFAIIISFTYNLRRELYVTEIVTYKVYNELFTTGYKFIGNFKIMMQKKL